MTAKQKLWAFYRAVPLSHFSFPLIVAVLSHFSQGHFEVLPAEKDTTPHKEVFKKLHFNPFAPEPPVTARADPGPFYPL